MIIQHLIAPALTLALALGAASPIQAQDANAGAGAPPPWATESARPDHTKDIPTDEALLRQHLAGAMRRRLATSAQRKRCDRRQLLQAGKVHPKAVVTKMATAWPLR